MHPPSSRMLFEPGPRCGRSCGEEGDDSESAPRFRCCLRRLRRHTPQLCVQTRRDCACEGRIRYARRWGQRQGEREPRWAGAHNPNPRGRNAVKRVRTHARARTQPIPQRVTHKHAPRHNTPAGCCPAVCRGSGCNGARWWPSEDVGWCALQCCPSRERHCNHGGIKLGASWRNRADKSVGQGGRKEQCRCRHRHWPSQRQMRGRLPPEKKKQMSQCAAQSARP